VLFRSLTCHFTLFTGMNCLENKVSLYQQNDYIYKYIYSTSFVYLFLLLSHHCTKDGKSNRKTEICWNYERENSVPLQWNQTPSLFNLVHIQQTEQDLSLHVFTLDLLCGHKLTNKKVHDACPITEEKLKYW
jgi:hypothetical protein